MTTSNNIAIPWLRKRMQSSRHYYYFEVPNSNPRQEIALGPNRDEALVQRQSLLIRHWYEHPLSKDPLVNLLLQYQNIHVPLLDSLSKKENLASIKNLVNFFACHACSICEIESPSVAQQYLRLRNPKLPMRAKSDLSLLKRVVKVSQSWYK